jgi:hypothetical protein
MGHAVGSGLLNGRAREAAAAAAGIILACLGAGCEVDYAVYTPTGSGQQERQIAYVMVEGRGQREVYDAITFVMPMFSNNLTADGQSKVVSQSPEQRIEVSAESRPNKKVKLTAVAVALDPALPQQPGTARAIIEHVCAHLGVPGLAAREAAAVRASR